jgi:small-conductance mechanosensitive channel
MIVPNTKFIDSPVTNWTYGDPRVRFRVPVGVAYGSDLEKARNALLEVARENPQVLDEPSPTVFLEAFGGSSINLELVVWSKEMSYRPRRFRSDLNFAIARKLHEAGVEIPSPQRDISFREGFVRVELTGAQKKPERAVADGA